MSRKISQVFQDAYDAEVKRAYGDTMLLKDTVYKKTGIVGKSVYFRKKGKGMAKQHNGGSDIVAMNVDYTQVECVLEDWEAFDYVDKFDAKKINFSEVRELAEVASDALGLRMDQIIIDKVNAGFNVANTVGTTNTPLTVASLRAAAKILNKTGAPKGERFFIHDAQQLDDLLGTTEVTSSDYNTVKTLVQGEINTFLGLKFICIADRDEGGLPKPNANDVRGFVWHKRAVGFALGQDLETSMDWIPEKRAYLVGGDFSAGAVVIDDKGIVAVVSKASA